VPAAGVEGFRGSARDAEKLAALSEALDESGLEAGHEITLSPALEESLAGWSGYRPGYGVDLATAFGALVAAAGAGAWIVGFGQELSPQVTASEARLSTSAGRRHEERGMALALATAGRGLMLEADNEDAGWRGR
jgi:hypothetical protein